MLGKLDPHFYRIPGESQVLLESLLLISSEAIICINENLEVLLFNPGAEAIFGYSSGEIIGDSLNLLIPSAYHSIHSEHIKEFISAGESSRIMHQRYPIWGLRKNGEQFPARASIAKYRFGNTLVLSVILREITAQKQMEERLQKLSVVVEQTPAVVVVTDTDGRIEYVNPAFEHVTGYSSAEVIGETPRILKSGQMSKELYQEMWGTISSGKVWKGELCNRKKNGELYWDFGTVSPIKNAEGIITNYIAVKEDITQGKLAEEELQKHREHLEELVGQRTFELRQEIIEHKQTETILRESENRLAEAQRIAQLGSWDWNLLTGELVWSDETYRIFGINPVEFELNFASALDLVHPDNRELVQVSLDRAISKREPVNIDFLIILPDGQERVVTLNAIPVAEDDGSINQMVGTIQNITERKRTELELLEKERMNKELAIGESIQLSMLPKVLPELDGWQFSAYYQAANQVGGDFYDIFPLSDGKFGFVIADISGKGIPAALFMTLSKAIVRLTAFIGHSARSTLTRSNIIIFNEFQTNEFLTICYAILDPENGFLEFANAGHNHPLWYSSESGRVKEMIAKGIPLGIFKHILIDEKTVEIKPGDILVFYTDGLTESTNIHGDYFGERRLRRQIKLNADKSAKDIIDNLMDTCKDFVGDNPQADDITLVVIKRDS